MQQSLTEFLVTLILVYECNFYILVISDVQRIQPLNSKNKREMVNVSRSELLCLQIQRSLTFICIVTLSLVMKRIRIASQVVAKEDRCTERRQN